MVMRMGGMCCVIFELRSYQPMQSPLNLRSPITNRMIGLFLGIVAVLFFPEIALAADPTEALPYDKGLKAFQTSLQGPVPFAISLVGIVACGAMLIFGGEISGFMRTMIFIILVISVIVQANSVVKLLGGTGSLVTSHVMPYELPARSIT